MEFLYNASSLYSVPVADHLCLAVKDPCLPVFIQPDVHTMSRLASFKGPSTPTSSPVQAKQPATSSPSRLIESTYHRKVRTLLQELRAVTETWDDIVLIDGLKAAKSLVDARTDLE